MLRNFALLIATIATVFATIVMVWSDASALMPWVLPSLGIATLIVVPVLVPPLVKGWLQSPLGKHGHITVAGLISFSIILLYAHHSGFDAVFSQWFNSLKWDALGAVGQILIAILAVWVAWRQNEISETLTKQQNAITQQQTIDTYFQGVSDLVLDPQGLLEDWPLERAIAQARTSAILGGADPEGRSKIIRFLSSANLLTPLKRDGLLGRAILDGTGGYVVDLAQGVRVVNLGMMLAGKDISHTDLRGVDLSGANLLRANLQGCDFTGANLAGTILAQANLRETDLSKVRLFYGSLETTSPRDRNHPPNFETGAYTGAVIEEADFTNAKDLSEENRRYIAAWGGKKTRRTLTGGANDVANRLGR
ncbi:MAG: pentapeptide repeat-containing protein [Pseudanabaenaceae cyanobacterium]|jgi:uncharacterized protein YjbI with pentapeptide repeats